MVCLRSIYDKTEKTGSTNKCWRNVEGIQKWVANTETNMLRWFGHTERMKIKLQYQHRKEEEMGWKGRNEGSYSIAGCGWWVLQKKKEEKFKWSCIK